MGRKTLPMKLISNKRARLVSFEKRKKSLKKAAYELSTLCGVDIGMIVCNCESNESEVWPPNSGGALPRMIELYESSSDQDRRLRMFGLADYVREERKKEEKTREKRRKDACQNLSYDQLREMGDFLKTKIGAVREEIGLMKAEPDVFMSPSLQESGVLATNDAGQQQQQQLWACFGPDQENVGFALNNAGQQQQQLWACFDLDQENVGFATNDAGKQQQQLWACFDPGQENVGFAMNNAGPQQQQLWAGFDSYQENVVFATNAGQRKQQHWTYFDQGHVFMIPSLQESGVVATNAGQQRNSSS